MAHWKWVVTIGAAALVGLLAWVYSPRHGERFYVMPGAGLVLGVTNEDGPIPRTRVAVLSPGLGPGSSTRLRRVSFELAGDRRVLRILTEQPSRTMVAGNNPGSAARAYVESVFVLQKDPQGPYDLEAFGIKEHVPGDNLLDQFFYRINTAAVNEPTQFV